MVNVVSRAAPARIIPLLPPCDPRSSVQGNSANAPANCCCCLSQRCHPFLDFLACYLPVPLPLPALLYKGLGAVGCFESIHDEEERPSAGSPQETGPQRGPRRDPCQKEGREGRGLGAGFQ